MGKIKAIECDGLNCEVLMREAEATTVTVRYEGEMYEGQYTRHLCPDCISIPEDVTLSPLRRRSATAGPPDETPAATT